VSRSPFVRCLALVLLLLLLCVLNAPLRPLWPGLCSDLSCSLPRAGDRVPLRLPQDIWASQPGNPSWQPWSPRSTLAHSQGAGIMFTRTHISTLTGGWNHVHQDSHCHVHRELESWSPRLIWHVYRVLDRPSTGWDCLRAGTPLARACEHQLSAHAFCVLSAQVGGRRVMELGRPGAAGGGRADRQGHRVAPLGQAALCAAPH